MRVRVPILSVCSSSNQRAEGSEGVLLKMQVASISLFIPREQHLKPPTQPIALADLRSGPRSGRSLWSVYWQRNVATKIIISLCWIMVMSMWQCFLQGLDRKSSALLQGNLVKTEIPWYVRERKPGPFRYVLAATLVSSPLISWRGSQLNLMFWKENDTPNHNPTLIILDQWYTFVRFASAQNSRTFSFGTFVNIGAERDGVPASELDARL